ncbi:MAG: AMP-binding protein [Candidatus Melainabacteria bacterium]|nr:AMP-binding protein [Candidatus Melainabacteria bacterium]
MEVTDKKAPNIAAEQSEICSESALESYENSLGQMLLDRVRRLGKSVMLKDKDANGQWREHSFEEVMSEISNLGAYLLKSGVKAGDRLAMLSENRREMLCMELAAMCIGAISVPIFPGYFSQQIEYIIQDSGAVRLTVSTNLQLMKLSHCKDLHQIESIFLMDCDETQAPHNLAAPLPVIPYRSLSEFQEDRFIKQFFQELEAVTSDQSCLIMYTSGTTGNPKGVELRHSNLLSQQRAINQLWGISNQERFLSYLPWHHSFGGLFERFMALYSGACMAIDESGGKDMHVLIENWQSVRPTIFFSVPGVFQKLADEIQQSDNVRNTIFHPELRFVFTAAAPLPRDVSKIFNAENIPVLEGWGLTETSPCVTLTDPEKERVPGVVGWPIPGVKIRISDHGEIQVNGPNVMKGYWNLPVQNRECFTEDGWFRTGDLGEMHEHGLRILGRHDGVFKLLNAEKVFSAQIEMALIEGSIFIEHAVVVGSGQHFVTALIYANRRLLEEWGRKHGIRIPEGDDIASVSDIRRLFSHEVQRINSEIGGRYQRVRKFVVFGSPLSLEAGELTPSSKVVRNKVIANRGEVVEALYKPGCPPPANIIVCLGDCY